MSSSAHHLWPTLLLAFGLAAAAVTWAQAPPLDEEATPPLSPVEEVTFAWEHGVESLRVRDLEGRELDAEVDRWVAELMERSPTALALAKASFNADSESIRGISALGMRALSLYYATDESKEGGRAFREKRKPDFRKYVE